MSTALETFIRAMPRVELHVHLEGAIRPETLLCLAQQHRMELPAATVEELREWYYFQDFSHFVQTYLKISECIRTPEDLELVVRDFLAGQAAQNILYSEVTYTAFTHYHFKGLPFAEQLAAINRARAWAERELDTGMGLILDIPRPIDPDHGMLITEWAIAGMGQGVVALGVAGPEADFPIAPFAACFARAHQAGLPCIPHAGETAGAESMWEALHITRPVRIGHGVRCLEAAALVEALCQRQIPLEVCPSSNVCLGIVDTLANHPLPRLLAAGLYVTINSDDPPMFNTTLTDEYLRIAETFALDEETIAHLVLNGIRATLLPAEERARLEERFVAWRAGR
jgi:adenosine deaminase